MEITEIAGNERMRRGVGGGVVSGLVSGLVLAVYLTVMNVAQGGDLWIAAKGAALPFLGERVHQPGFDAAAVLLGVLCHMAISIGWGALFGAIVYGLSKGLTVLAGIAWGIVVWIGMYYAVLPLVGAGDFARSVPVSSAIVTHVLFGLVLGIAFLPYQRTVTRTTDLPTHHVPLPH